MDASGCILPYVEWEGGADGRDDQEGNRAVCRYETEYVGCKTRGRGGGVPKTTGGEREVVVSDLVRGSTRLLAGGASEGAMTETAREMELLVIDGTWAATALEKRKKCDDARLTPSYEVGYKVLIAYGEAFNATVSGRRTSHASTGHARLRVQNTRYTRWSPMKYADHAWIYTNGGCPCTTRALLISSKALDGPRVSGRGQG